MSPAPRNRAEPVHTKDAELIAFRVGEYHPRRVTLPDIGPPSTEGKETFDFCGLIDRTEVRMESVLACLLLRNQHEQQARHPIRSRPDLELVRGVAHDNPAQRLGPPSTKRDRIASVNDDLLPNEIHVAHSARSVSQADAPTDVERNTVRVVAADKLDDSCSPRHQRDWQVGPQSVIAGRVRCGRLRFLLWGCARELHR